MLYCPEPNRVAGNHPATLRGRTTRDPVSKAEAPDQTAMVRLNHPQERLVMRIGHQSEAAQTCLEEAQDVTAATPLRIRPANVLKSSATTAMKRGTSP